MAGMSRSEYLRSREQKKPSALKLLLKILFSVAMIVLLPQLIIFAMGLYIVLAIMWKSVKMGIDLPDYR